MTEKQDLMRLTGAKDGGDLDRLLASRLSSRERNVIVRRYGLATGHAETLKSIAAETGVSVERIRQVEAKAVLHVIKPARAKHRPESEIEGDAD